MNREHTPFFIRDMLRLRPDIPNNDKIRNIIFDFGGVICDIDVSKTAKRFDEFGEAVNTTTVNETPSDFIKIVAGLESGKISVESFINSIQRHYKKTPSALEIIDAWNALLGEIPGDRVKIIEDIRRTYNIYLLSNTNVIHYEKYLDDFRKKFGYNGFEDLFIKFYRSCDIGYIKPGRDIYDFVLRDAQIDPTETLFVDDTPENVEGSLVSGMQGYFLKKGEDIRDLFVFRS